MNETIINELLEAYNDLETQVETHSDRHNDYCDHNNYQDAHSPVSGW